MFLVTSAILLLLNIVFHISTHVHASEDLQNVYVSITDGMLMGYSTRDYFGDPYYGFQSVPFAEPPVGDLRFEPPVPVKPWSGILDATVSNNICPQSMEWIDKSLNGSEDCLYLHVYTKSLTEDPAYQMPVMVWIHGGGFTGGSVYDGYGPGFIVSQDVVLVLIQYRLGQLGFLSINDTRAGVPGNNGLKDQVLALKWVQNNIRKFGGNPNQVTIFGESAGGASVHLHVLSPQSKGLFHRAIASSGYADILIPDREYYTDLVDIVNCNNYTDVKDKVECLKSRSTEEILKADVQIRTMLSDVKISTLGLTIEPESENAFLTKPIDEIIKSSQFNQVPFIMGFNADDGILAYYMRPRAKVNVTNYEMFVPIDLHMTPGSAESIKLGNKIKQFYYGSKTPTELCDEWILYQTDNAFLHDLYRYALMHANISQFPVYFYEFKYSTELNFNNVKYYRPLVAHADDDHYLFVFDRTPAKMDPTSDEYIGVHRIVTLWTTFAKSTNADPNPSHDKLVPVHWNELNTEIFNYLEISPDLVEKTFLANDRMIFWQQVYAQNNVSNSHF